MTGRAARARRSQSTRRFRSSIRECALVSPCSIIFRSRANFAIWRAGISGGGASAPGSTSNRRTRRQVQPRGRVRSLHRAHPRASRPARPRYHDLFGALIWLHFPLLKTAIHQAQLAIEGGRRGARENAATHLDESAQSGLELGSGSVSSSSPSCNWPDVVLASARSVASKPRAFSVLVTGSWTRCAFPTPG